MEEGGVYAENATREKNKEKNNKKNKEKNNKKDQKEIQKIKRRGGGLQNISRGRCAVGEY